MSPSYTARGIGDGSMVVPVPAPPRHSTGTSDISGAVRYRLGTTGGSLSERSPMGVTTASVHHGSSVVDNVAANTIAASSTTKDHHKSKDVLLNLQLYNSVDGRRFRVAAAAALRNESQTKYTVSQRFAGATNIDSNVVQKSEKRHATHKLQSRLKASRHTSTSRSCVGVCAHKSLMSGDVLEIRNHTEDSCHKGERYTPSWVETMQETNFYQDKNPNPQNTRAIDRRKDLVGFVKKQLQKRRILTSAQHTDNTADASCDNDKTQSCNVASGYFPSWLYPDEKQKPSSKDHKSEKSSFEKEHPLVKEDPRRFKKTVYRLLNLNECWTGDEATSSGAPTTRRSTDSTDTPNNVQSESNVAYMKFTTKPKRTSYEDSEGTTNTNEGTDRSHPKSSDISRVKPPNPKKEKVRSVEPRHSHGDIPWYTQAELDQRAAAKYRQDCIASEESMPSCRHLSRGEEFQYWITLPKICKQEGFFVNQDKQPLSAGECLEKIGYKFRLPRRVFGHRDDTANNESSDTLSPSPSQRSFSLACVDGLHERSESFVKKSSKRSRRHLDKTLLFREFVKECALHWAAHSIRNGKEVFIDT